ncbi:MAG: class I SAM-dependent methyltransferase [Bacteroidota bacterium]
MENLIGKATDEAHRLMALAVKPGDTVVDATVGNGFDTEQLARWVGPAGRVIGFDVQALAIHATRHRLERAGLADRVELHEAGHETMGDHVPDGLAAAVFNLGYLPRADKTIVTQPATTVPALDAAFERLRAGGLLCVVIYTGHNGGAEEAAAVEAWAQAIPSDAAIVTRMQRVNPQRPAPYLVTVQRR